MVTKYVLCIDDSATHGPNDHKDIQSLLKNNIYLHCILTKYKNKITEHYKNKQWDRYKKLTNEYELIFTTPNTGSNISRYCPVSRSFFKMWEILHDFWNDFAFDSENLNVMFLAEGPGGFAEAVVKYRNNNDDSYYGISLKSNSKNIPEWKFLQRIDICYGMDGTGDLYNRCNLDYMKEHLPKMNMITADGGFDFSNDFNKQEEASIRLILCEIYAALTLQKTGGVFILKIYDMFHENTLKIVSFLKQFYEKIFIVKPLSSRPANSEKYLVCTGYRGCDKEDISQLSILIGEYTGNNVKRFFDSIKHNHNVLHNLICYNIYYTLRQVYYIEQTISYINEFGKSYHDVSTKEQMAKLTEMHKMKAIKWCEKYNIDHF